MLDRILSIEISNSFDYSSTFEIYRECANKFVTHEAEGVELLVNILQARHKFDEKLDPMLADLIEAVGFYPYLRKENLELQSTSALVRMSSNHSHHVSDRVFHDEQKLVFDILNAGKNLVVSAPTSFGKSLLIEEMVASKNFKNIVIIQPTLALLDETRKKLGKYRDSYKLILRTSQEPDQNRGNIFLLTAERVNEYRDFPKIDFLIVDEFYKISAKRDDERADALNNAVLYLLKTFEPQFYLAGPNVDKVSQEFLERYNAEFFLASYTLVGTKIENVYERHPNKFGDLGKKKTYKENVLFELLDDLSEEQTLVYCASPSRARSLARSYLVHLKGRGLKARNNKLPIYDWISENVSPLWSLIELIEYGIGFHDGALQRHITTTIIDYFDVCRISVLFCTSTIIEGVNTNAKNIVYFDQRKGKELPIDYFDYANIRGRAGRLMEHYIGRVFNFGAPPEKDIIYIDVPFVDQAPISDEVLINLENNEIKDDSTEQYKYISQFSSSERELFAANAICVRGQVDLLQSVRENIRANRELLCWDGTPTYEQLEYTLGLAWDCLLQDVESVKPMTKKWIIKLTFDYGLNKSINAIVKDRFDYARRDPKKAKKSDAILMDDAIRDSFQIMRHWFQYKIPKWLLVVDRIQRFVCAEIGQRPGNYVYYATLLENDFIRENLSILSEFGIPRSAIVKLEKYIRPDLSQDEVISSISARRLYRAPQLTDYEREKIELAIVK
ncbi:DEAD/DEAH box helicase [Massilia sp. CT11-108]|uniref:DEAD/DEAH box helicase n=1 Tax=Massilia sp. CT11-108 TaxID=3393900 RepID=UPI0039A544F8